jgi:hypothetical protein
MKIIPLGLLLILSGHVFAQTYFDNYVKTLDSLNVLNYRQNRDAGQFDKAGKKIGHWTEYKLLTDSADTLIPVTVEGMDFKFNFEIPNSTTLQKSEGSYKHGLVNGLWQWFESDYDTEKKLTWRLSRRTEFKKGKKNGHEIEFGVFGEIHRKAKYSNDRLNGYETIYWSRDVLLAKILWKADVVQKADVFYQSGQIQKTQKLQDNVMWTITEYHENGKIKARYQESGEGKEGEYLEYDETGNLIITRYFKNGSEGEK